MGILIGILMIILMENFHWNLMESWMMDSMGWPYDSSGCPLFREASQKMLGARMNFSCTAWKSSSSQNKKCVIL